MRAAVEHMGRLQREMEQGFSEMGREAAESKKLKRLCIPWSAVD